MGHSQSPEADTNGENMEDSGRSFSEWEWERKCVDPNIETCRPTVSEAGRSPCSTHAHTNRLLNTLLCLATILAILTTNQASTAEAPAASLDFSPRGALLKYTYTQPGTSGSTTSSTHAPTVHSTVISVNLTGLFGRGSMSLNATGELIHVVVADGANHGCDVYTNPLPTSSPQTENDNNNNAADPPSWIALVARGGCRFQTKIDMADLHNATAIIIYDNVHQDADPGTRDLIVMDHLPTNLTTVTIMREDGLKLAAIVDREIPVYMTITLGMPGQIGPTAGPNGPRHTTAVLLTFVGFLIVGLIVVVAYAVRHAKHVHTRNQANMDAIRGMRHQGAATLLNNIGPPDPPPPLMGLPPGHPGPPLPIMQLQAQALLPQITEENEEEEKGDSQQQNHHPLDVPQSSPLLPHS